MSWLKVFKHNNVHVLVWPCTSHGQRIVYSLDTGVTDCNRMITITDNSISYCVNVCLKWRCRQLDLYTVYIVHLHYYIENLLNVNGL